MAIKSFLIVRSVSPRAADSWHAALLDAAREGWPALSWRFGRTAYEPHRYAYAPDGTLQSFDWSKELSLERVESGTDDPWEFVQAQCHQDDVAPQVFGESARMRYQLVDEERVHLRFAFNHALVDGLNIFRFLTALETALGQRGLRLEALQTDPISRRRVCRTQRVEYTVEDLDEASCPGLAHNGFSYLSLLRELVRGRRMQRVCQVIASPRHVRVQLAVAPVRRAVSFARFCARNQATIRDAQRGNRLCGLWRGYAKDPATGDRVMRFLFENRYLGHRAFRWSAGTTLVSGFMMRHPRHLVFPVAQALQREGIAICAVWEGERGRVARIVSARNLVWR